MSYSNRCPPACPPYPLCNVAPIINSRVYGSGRLFQPYPLAMQAPGYAYIDGDQNPATPLLPCGPCGPNGAVPRAPDGFTTDVVGAGILSPVRWRGAGVFADNYALPGDIAREPNEGWWASETIDADTGKRSWITGMSGIGGSLGALTMPSWFNNTFISIGGIRIPNWIGWGLIAFVAYRVAKKRGMIKNRRASRAVRRAKSKWLFSPGGKVANRRHQMFNTATRRHVAEQFAKDFETENALGNYKSLLPKKYQKNRSRRRSRRA